jgi:hypothetical protein
MLAAYAPLSMPSEITLTQAELDLEVADALQRWSDQYGTEPPAMAIFEVSDLRGLALGEELDNTVLIDATAAGHGWSLTGEIGKMDLLVVVMHELGHVMGFEHTPGLGSQTEMMGAFLAPQWGSEPQVSAAEKRQKAVVERTFDRPVGKQSLHRRDVQRMVVLRSSLLTNPSFLRYIERWKKFSRQSVADSRFSSIPSRNWQSAACTWK